MSRAAAIAPLLLALTLASCSDERALNGEPSPPAPFVLKDTLGAWERRFADPPPGASDAPLPELADGSRTELRNLLLIATSTSPPTQRFASAVEDLRAAGSQAIAAAAAFLTGEDPIEPDKVFAIWRDKPPAELLTLCLHLIESGKPAVRKAALRVLGTHRVRHALPRVLLRLKYEENIPCLAAACETLAQLGNPIGIRYLLGWQSDPQLAATSESALIRILEIHGRKYEESDGPDSLRRQARTILDEFQAKGAVAPGAGAALDEVRQQVLDREIWLFLKHLGGKPLGPVDDARFVCRQAGLAPVALLREALQEKTTYVRVHSLEILHDLGRPGYTAAPEIKSLFADRLCRSYALEAYGGVGADDALTVLSTIVDPRNKALPFSTDERVAALHGLRRLASPDAVQFLLWLWRNSKNLEMRVHIAGALIASARGAEDEARAFLEKLLEEGSGHPPTLREFLGR